MRKMFYFFKTKYEIKMNKKKIVRTSPSHISREMIFSEKKKFKWTLDKVLKNEMESSWMNDLFRQNRKEYIT